MPGQQRFYGTTRIVGCVNLAHVPGLGAALAEATCPGCGQPVLYGTERDGWGRTALDVAADYDLPIEHLIRGEA